MSDPLGSIIVKPCKQEEINFYQSISLHPEFAEYVPIFIGTLALSSEPSQALAPAALIPPDGLTNQPSGQPQIVDAVAIEKAWAPSNGGKITTDSAVVLENVTAGFKRPNVLDVKLGARLWADDAPAAKRERLDKVASETTSASLGLRIAGMRIWQGLDAVGQENVALDGYKIYDKDYGKKFTSNSVGQGFREYFCLKRSRLSNRSIRKVIRRFLHDLQGMHDVLEKEESRMYSASLLFVYEGDDEALEDAIAKEKELKNSEELEIYDTVSMIAEASSNGDRRDDTLPFKNGTAFVHEARPTNGTTIPTEMPISRPPPNGEVVETDDDDEEEEGPAIQALKLIDFAHAEWTPGRGRDMNLLYGIRNVMDILHRIQTDITPMKEIEHLQKTHEGWK